MQAKQVGIEQYEIEINLYEFKAIVMLNKIKQIKNNTYIMQIATLMSGTLIAQVVTLAFIPIITRLYTPAEFGLYSLFFSIVSILGLVSSLKYDQAIMLPKSDKDAQALVFLSILITFATVVLVILGLLIFQDFFVNYFSGATHFVWMIPFGVLLLGLLQIFNAYSSRRQFYKKLATVKVANSLTVASVQSSSKYFFALDGLVLGKLMADGLSLFLLLRFHVKKQTLQLSSLSKRRVKANVKRHDHFPKYQSFTVFFNALSQNIPVLLFASLYSAEVAGLYALTVRVLQVPVGLIGASTKEVYYQRASKMYANGEDIFNLYKKTTLALLKIFIIPFLTVLFFGEYLFGFVFGEQWTQSGEIAQLLIFWTFIGFINSPSVMSYSILNFQKIQMRVEFLSVFLRFSAIYLGFYFYNSYMNSILFFVLVSLVTNLFIILFIFVKLKKGVRNDSYSS
ncbi:MAG: oligosaccharide flippase family protein [Campylobacterota bacterium]|nr:oligosaccharide flippase family protein [Campylobacterota bacterium]